MMTKRNIKRQSFIEDNSKPDICSVLRFGNHDRLPHPDNCQQYFTCLRTGGGLDHDHDDENVDDEDGDDSDDDDDEQVIP